MKKFIISKNRAMNVASEPLTHQTIDDMDQKVVTKVEVHPPLPLDPPPPDDLPLDDMTYKPEPTSDAEIHSCATPFNTWSEDTTDDASKSTNEDLHKKKQSSAAVCRDFIRGTCKRNGNCKFEHRYDVSQLYGVYTFCRDFQTSKCTRNCKYVHASVFEEQHFYRSGYLPPKAFAHHHNFLTPPPPPPPEEPQTNFTSQPPPLQPEISQTPPPVMNSVLQNNLTATGNMFQQKPSKRVWNTPQEPITIQVKSPFSDREESKMVTKKCIHCDDSETRLQYHTLKVHKMREAINKLKNNIAIVDKKSDSLQTMIFSLMKTMTTKSPTL